jgi:Cdc6-like AAA superfamily ATPase
MDKNEFTSEDMDVFTFSVGNAILRRDEAYRAIDALADAAGESWFELGEKLERKRVLNTIDNLMDRLVDSEEDAKMALVILKEMIENAEEEGSGDSSGE